MGKYSGKTCRIICMLGLTASFFLVEIVVGFVTNSLALVGDSYHMLSDVVALLIGLASIRISKWRSQKNTYGWARAEVLGALVNAVFLIALCFTIFVEALQRIFDDGHKIKDPNLLLIVGGIGLFINLIGLGLFAGHGHSHGGGGHGHSHGGGHAHSGGDKHHHSDTEEPEEEELRKGQIMTVTNSHITDPSVDVDISDDEVMNISTKSSKKLKSGANLNMQGVFLHVLGDAMGSVVVIISALVIKYVDHEWKHKVDPAMSMVMVLIILCTTIPLLKESAFILLQTVPTHIQVTDLKQKLISKIEGVLAVHEFHIWQLAGNRIIASAHIRCQNLRDYMRIAEEVKSFFHHEGIHSTTIQPEFTEFEEMKPGRDCALECGPDKNCYLDTCCASKREQLAKANSSGDLRQRAASTHSLTEGLESHMDPLPNVSSSVSFPDKIETHL